MPRLRNFEHLVFAEASAENAPPAKFWISTTIKITIELTKTNYVTLGPKKVFLQ